MNGVMMLDLVRDIIYKNDLGAALEAHIFFFDMASNGYDIPQEAQLRLDSYLRERTLFEDFEGVLGHHEIRVLVELSELNLVDPLREARKKGADLGYGYTAYEWELDFEYKDETSPATVIELRFGKDCMGIKYLCNKPSAPDQPIVNSFYYDGTADLPGQRADLFNAVKKHLEEEYGFTAWPPARVTGRIK